MSAPDSKITTQPAGLPGILRAEADEPSLPPRSWAWTIAPAYAGVFIAFPLLDRLGVGLGADQSTSLVPASGMAVLGVLASYLLVYDPLALWGRSSGRRLGLTSASALGTRGAEWICGLGTGLGAILAYAVALHMALRLVFLGLISCGLLDPEELQPWRFGPLEVERPVFVVTAAFWIFITGTARVLKLASVVFAMMQVYTPVALGLLAATALLTSSGLPAFLHGGSPGQAVVAAAARALPDPAATFQLVFAAFAFSGLFAVEWGMVVRRREDVRLGGWVGILLTGSLAVVLAMLTVAGAIGKVEVGHEEIFPRADVLTSLFSLHWAILNGIGGLAAAAILMLFGLASLAPTCYANDVYSRRLADHWPVLGRTGWTWLGSLPAFFLVGTSLAGRLEPIFGLMGAVFAPMAAVIAADAVLRRFRWAGVREGWNPPGVIAYAAGVTAGLVLRGRIEPSALAAYMVAAAAYLIATTALPSRPMLPVPPPGAPDA